MDKENTNFKKLSDGDLDKVSGGFAKIRNYECSVCKGIVRSFCGDCREKIICDECRPNTICYECTVCKKEVTRRGSINLLLNKARACPECEKNRSGGSL